MKCVGRTPSSVTLELPPESLNGVWRLDVLEVVGWLWESTWVPAPRAPIVTQGGAAAHADDEKTPCHLLVPGLCADSEYSFRIVRELGDDLSCSCRTISRPLNPATPVCVRRMPKALTVEWIVPSPEDRPVSTCQLHYRADAFYSPWREASAQHVDPTAGTQHESKWRAVLEGLDEATDHVFRARSGNQVGWSASFSELGKSRTSDPPVAPANLEVLARHPGAVTVKFEIEDMEGAPTGDVEVEIAGPMQWNPAPDYTKDLSPPRRRSGHWYNDRAYQAAGRGAQHSPASSDALRAGKVRIGSLPLDVQAEQDVVIRIWAWNAIGRSMSSSSELVCHPSRRPEPAHGLRCVGRWKNGVSLEWCSRDPDGAPVTACSLEYRTDHMLDGWQPIADSVISCPPRASPGEVQEEAASTDGGKSNQGHWDAVLQDLEAESWYHFRVYVLNEVGCSDAPEPFQCRTADRPTIRHPPRCIAISATSVTLEFKVVCDPVQMSCMETLTAIAIDRSALLVWEPVLDTHLSLMSSRVKLKKRTTEQADDKVADTKLEDGEEAILKCKARVSGLSGNTPYSFRIWACNDVGWSLMPSPAMDCCTSLIPEAPLGLEAYAVGPHTVAVHWEVPDPEGAQVKGGQVQAHENTLFSYWQVLQADALLDSVKACRWKQVVHSLKPSVEYSLRARAWNASGWSDWSESIVCSTPKVPQIGEVRLVQNVGSLMDRDGKRRVSISFEVVEHSAAPAIICMVTCSSDGYEILACRRQNTRWGACFNYNPEMGSNFTRFEVCAASAVGWGKTCEILLEKNADMGNCVPQTGLSTATVRQTISEFIAVELARSKEQQAVLELLVHSVDVADEPPKSERCWPHLKLLQLVVLNLEDLRLLPQRSFSELAAWTSDCKAYMDMNSNISDEQPEQVVEAFHLLIEGGFSLELMCSELLEPLWVQVCDASNAAARSCSSKIWEQKAAKWCNSFHRQIIAVWKNAFVNSARLLSAITALGSLSTALEHVVHDLTALMVLRDNADQMLQELHSALEEFKMEKSPGAEVALSVYELHGASALNAMTDLAGLGRAYHVGVEVYWLEWSFGYCEEGSGVQAVQVGESSLGTLNRRIPLGITPCSLEEFFNIIGKLQKEWSGSSYQLLRRNCGHFSAELVQHLRVGDVPDWVNSLAMVGDQLTKWLRSEDDAPLLGSRSELPPVLAGANPQDVSVVPSDADASDSLSESCWERRFMLRRRAKARGAQSTDIE